MLLNVLENYNDTRGLVLYDHLKKIETLFFEERIFCGEKWYRAFLRGVKWTVLILFH